MKSPFLTYKQLYAQLVQILNKYLLFKRKNGTALQANTKGIYELRTIVEKELIELRQEQFISYIPKFEIELISTNCLDFRLYYE